MHDHHLPQHQRCGQRRRFANASVMASRWRLVRPRPLQPPAPPWPTSANPHTATASGRPSRTAWRDGSAHPGLHPPGQRRALRLQSRVLAHRHVAAAPVRHLSHAIGPLHPRSRRRTKSADTRPSQQTSAGGWHSGAPHTAASQPARGHCPDIAINVALRLRRSGAFAVLL